jgi:GNAT superfamily N-acetyltransferase
VNVTRLTPADFLRSIDALAEILADCVNGGASVSFMAPFSRADAVRHFESILPAVVAGKRAIFAAEWNGKILGTAQLDFDTPPNQPHRVAAMKVLVHRTARRHGLAKALMRALEDETHKAGRRLITFDTVTGSPAEKLYASLGYQRAGVIPGYALMPDGALADTTVFYKLLKD